MKRAIEEKFQTLGGVIPIGDQFVPMDERELKMLEQRFQFSLPEDYRDFLKSYGASMFSEYVDFAPVHSLPFPISETGKGHLSSFYGAERDLYQPLIKEIESFHGRIPGTMIPIADDNGNKICLGIRSQE